MSDFVKIPCKHCPFRNDITPYLHPSRAEELAYAAQNPFNSFPCHKTTEFDEDSEDGQMMVTEKSKECAGFLTLMAQSGIKTPEGFVPSWGIIYVDEWEMIEAHQAAWDAKYEEE